MWRLVRAIQPTWRRAGGAPAAALSAAALCLSAVPFTAPIASLAEGSDAAEEEEKPDKETTSEGEKKKAKAECGFCKFMRAGPCGDEFTKWEECLEEHEDGDYPTLCSKQTIVLTDCMKRHKEYYGDLLPPEEDGEAKEEKGEVGEELRDAGEKEQQDGGDRAQQNEGDKYQQGGGDKELQGEGAQKQQDASDPKAPTADDA